MISSPQPHNDHSAMPSELQDISEELIAIGRRFDARGWVLGTSGTTDSGAAARALVRRVNPGARVNPHACTAEQGRGHSCPNPGARWLACRCTHARTSCAPDQSQRFG